MSRPRLERGPPTPGPAQFGEVVLGEVGSKGLRPTETLADPGTARAKLYSIAEAHSLSPTFPPEVMAEVAALMKSPGIDDPDLVDRTELPFITIDNEGSRDLDQAMHIERTPDGGFEVYYALADASYYVRPGSALHDEAMKRGVTYYFPGFAIPMLPPELSEGIVSLNEGVDRRALMTVTKLDADGKVESTRFERAKIRSRAKLTYDGVQDYLDGNNPALGGHAHTETLHLLEALGKKRIHLADADKIVRIRREELRADIDPQDPTRFVARSRGRNVVEKYNEQISLLSNTEAGAFLDTPGNAPWVTPIYKVHPEPLESRVKDFARLSGAIAETWGLDPKVWAWSPKEEALSDYLARLPIDGPHGRMTKAIEQQAVMINSASEFSAEPGKHHGIGAEPYARLSSPMREMVGIYTHKETLEKLSGEPPSGWVKTNEASREEMVEIGAVTKKRQRDIERAADALVLDTHLGSDLDLPEAERPTRVGTVLGLSAKKIYVRFDEPPFEVKLYVPNIEAQLGCELELDDGRARLRGGAPDGMSDIAIGAEIALKTARFDEEQGRYVLDVARVKGPEGAADGEQRRV